MSLKVGDKAPDFTLFSDAKQSVTLSELKGKNVVLLFFPLAFTGVCTKELCTMRDDIATYQGLNATILAVSVDSPFTLEQFKIQQNLNFPLLSDFNATVAEQYGSLYEDFVMGMKRVAKRSAFVIDSAGTVQYADVLESAGDLPNFEAVQATLSQLN